MKKFEQLAKTLSRYDKERGENNIIYYLLNGNIVGYRQDNIIVLYFACQRDIIWSNRDFPLVKVGIAKDFRLTKYDPICHKYRERKADVIVVDGYCGTCNAFTMYGKTFVQPTVDWFSYESEGAIGRTISKGHFVTFDESIEIKVPEYMCDFQLENLEYSILGIYKKSGNAKEYILPEYLRNVNDWHYGPGFDTEGSYEIRVAIERTKMQNYKQGHARAQIKFK